MHKTFKWVQPLKLGSYFIDNVLLNISSIGDVTVDKQNLMDTCIKHIKKNTIYGESRNVQ